MLYVKPTNVTEQMKRKVIEWSQTCLDSLIFLKLIWAQLLNGIKTTLDYLNFIEFERFKIAKRF